MLFAYTNILDIYNESCIRIQMHSNSFDVGLVDNVLNFKIALLRKIRNMKLLFTYDLQTTSSFIFIHKNGTFLFPM